MASVNQYDISAILHSEIAGNVRFGHGQIDSLGDVQRYLNLLHVERSSAKLNRAARANADLVAKAFRAVRNARDDRGSLDLYVADPARNAEFLAKCRELGVSESPYVINKTLFGIRKSGRLKGLHSKRTSINYEEFAFASEFAATELRYETGATIDDILCEPSLALRFDAIARRLAPGHSSFEYRWAMLSIRKLQHRRAVCVPPLTTTFSLVSDPIDSVPNTLGVYLISERTRPLYARATEHLRHGIDLHRQPQCLEALSGEFWQPEPKTFTVSYATLPEKKLLRPVEHRLIEEEKPIFNILRSAA